MGREGRVRRRREKGGCEGLKREGEEKRVIWKDGNREGEIKRRRRTMK